MHYKNLTLDKFQVDAIAAIEKNNSVVVSAPTGSGKTLIADYIIDRDLKSNVRVIYTAPIKALSNQKYKDFCVQYGEQKIGLVTGDVVKNADAPILVMTTEIYRNMVLSRDPMVHEVSYVIFDEIHYINDIERGYVWEESIIFSPDTVRFLCLSATIPNAQEFADWISAIQKHTVDVVFHAERPVPLHKLFYDSELGITTLKKIQEARDIPDYRYLMGTTRQRHAKAKKPSHIDLLREVKENIPCLFFTFSRVGCQRNATELFKAQLFPRQNPEISTVVRRMLADSPPEINDLDSTRILRTILPYGIGFHHAGLLPVLKDIVEELFSRGLINVLYTTETFAVGINMPAKSVCFESLQKYDGISFRYLNSKEYFQIAGRAGRRGIDDVGYCYAMIDRKDYDYHKIKRTIDADTEPLKSQFRLSVNTVLNLIKYHTASEIDEILCKSFDSYQKYGAQFEGKKNIVSHHTFANIKKRLEKMGYVKDEKLTEKGEFSSKIYSDEILLGELFATDFYTARTPYQILLLMACICFEPRESIRFYRRYHNRFIRELLVLIRRHPLLSSDARFSFVKVMTAIIDPCVNKKSFFDILAATNMPEGDLLRLLRQIIDRLHQVKCATKDMTLVTMVENCQTIIADTMQKIDVL